MLINLKDIPEEGQAYQVSRGSGELNEVLTDLIGSANYQCEFFIRPLLNATYELKGFIRSQMDDLCSRCGEDFVLPVDEKFREMMIPMLSMPRDGKYTHANHVSDLHNESISTVEYQGDVFDIGEYLHEVVGLSRPPNPAPPVDAKDKCTVCRISVKDHKFSYDQELVVKQNPFDVLKNLKLN